MKYFKHLVFPLVLVTVICFSALHFAQDRSADTVEVTIKAGKNWLHDFPLFLWIKLKNPPTYAIWIEDSEGHFVKTVYVSGKMGKDTWIDGKVRRLSALPRWVHQRNIRSQYGDLLPSKSQPLPDTVTGATPKTGSIKTATLDQSTFVVWVEVNHSVDYNDYYTAHAPKGSDSYSGGEGGSGQPALLYRCPVNSPGRNEITCTLMGHSSPDGSTGRIYDDLSNISSAKDIVEKITVLIR